MTKPRWLVVLVWIAVLLSAGEFFVRGVLRQNSAGVNDFGAPYVATRMWLQGHDPYDSAQFFPVWNSSGASSEWNGATDGSASHAVYPPPSFPILAPIAVFSWVTANKVLLGVTVIFYLTAVWMMLGWIEGDWNELKKPLFLAYALGLAPIHSALHVSNIAGLAGSLLLIGAFALLKNGKSLRGAVSVATAICIKLTVGIVFLPYLVRMREWRALRMISILVAVVAAVSLVPLLHGGTPWIADYRSNVAFVFTHGGAADVSSENASRFDLLNLQLPFYAIFHSRDLSAMAVGVVVVVLLGAWVFASGGAEGRSREWRLLLVAGLTVIGLLAFYQRYYSGVLLLMPMVWAVQRPERTSNRWVIGICCCFLVNTEALFRKFEWFYRLDQRFPTLTETVIGPHLCWLLLALAVILVSQLYVKDNARVVELTSAR